MKSDSIFLMPSYLRITSRASALVPLFWNKLDSLSPLLHKGNNLIPQTSLEMTSAVGLGESGKSSPADG